MATKLLFLLLLVSASIFAAKLDHHKETLLVDNAASRGNGPMNEDCGEALDVILDVEMKETKVGNPSPDNEVDNESAWESFKKKLLEKDEYKQKAVGPLPRTCEEAGATGETKLYTGDVHMEATGFRLVEKTVNCPVGAVQATDQEEVEALSLSSSVFPRNCADIIRENRWAFSMVYQVWHPDHTFPGPTGPVLIPIFVYCDMDTSGGGWTLFQRRQDGSENFFRNWADYTGGFGIAGGEYWLGLRLINMMTKDEPHSLYIRMQGRSNPNLWSFARYDSFTVADATDNYRLLVGSYSGNDTRGNSMGSTHHHNRQFSTFDNDNDGSSANCAESRSAGYWFGSCSSNNLNGDYGQSSCSRSIHWGSSSSSDVKRFVTMGFRPRDMW